MNQMFSERLDIKYGILYGLGKCMDTDLVIPEGVTKIVKSFGNSQGLNRIKSIVFPSTLKDIEIDVINKCNGLVRAVFKDGFIYSRAYLFSGLRNLEEVIFLKVLPNIGTSAFYNTKFVINKN